MFDDKLGGAMYRRRPCPGKVRYEERAFCVTPDSKGPDLKDFISYIVS